METEKLEYDAKENPTYKESIIIYYKRFIEFYNKIQYLTLQLVNVKSENAIIALCIHAIIMHVILIYNGNIHNALVMDRQSIADELFSVKCNLENVTNELAWIKLALKIPVTGDRVVALQRRVRGWYYVTATIVSLNPETLWYTVEWDDSSVNVGEHVHYADIALDQVRVSPKYHKIFEKKIE